MFLDSAKNYDRLSTDVQSRDFGILSFYWTDVIIRPTPIFTAVASCACHNLFKLYLLS